MRKSSEPVHSPTASWSASGSTSSMSSAPSGLRAGMISSSMIVPGSAIPPTDRSESATDSLDTCRECILLCATVLRPSTSMSCSVSADAIEVSPTALSDATASSSGSSCAGSSSSGSSSSGMSTPNPLMKSGRLSGRDSTGGGASDETFVGTRPWGAWMVSEGAEGGAGERRGTT